MRLLIVEDAGDIALAIKDAFARRQIRCDTAHTALNGEMLIGTTCYDLVILDLGLPDGDGVDLLRRLRTRGNACPVLILTARGAVESRIDGLRSGADDYMLKPFHFDELHERVQAIVRRHTGSDGKRLHVGDLQLDLSAREFTTGDQRLDVSTREGEVLELLMRRVDRVVPKRMFEDRLFGTGDGPSSNAIEVYVHRLRQHLRQAGLALTIQTVRGVGYMLLTS